MLKLIQKGEQGLSFNQAFAKARKEGAKTFKWRGRTFAAITSEEAHRPQRVYTSGLNIPEEELKERHPLKWKQVQEEKAQASLAPIKTMHNIDQNSGKDTTLYSYGTNASDGKAGYIANRDLNRLNEMERQLKTLDPNSEEYKR